MVKAGLATRAEVKGKRGENSMIRIFSILSVLTLLLLAISSGGTFWLINSDAESLSIKSTESTANSIAQNIAAKTRSLQSTISAFAAYPEVILAASSQNSAQMTKTATSLESLIPTAMKLRILPINISAPDTQHSPIMGNADLIMVQDTHSKPQIPFLHGEGKDRHLAITAAIKQDDQIIGVLLASLKFGFFQSILNNYQLSDHHISIKQGNTLLASVGKQTDNILQQNDINVPNTSWVVHYAHNAPSDTTTLMSFAGFILFPGILACLACFMAFRQIAGLIRQDQHSLIKVLQDLMDQKNIGSYPMQLNEMEKVSTSLIQLFKKSNLLPNSTDNSEPSNSETTDETRKKTAKSANIKDTELLGVSLFNTTDNIDVDEENDIASAPNLDSESISPTPMTTDSASEIDITSSIYRAYDIRGIAGQSLTEEIVFDIGKAIGSEAKEKGVETIIGGRDGRTSSESLSQALYKGINSTGVNILDLGLAPSPLVYFVAHHSEGKSGVVVTGSHNPAEYNGIKIVLKGESLAGEQITQIKQRVDAQNFISDTEGSIEENNQFVNEYIGLISEDIHLVRPMKVVIDGSNGAAGKLAPILLKTLGCEVVELFCDIDGTFPNHAPDPSQPENLSDLISAVEQHQADVGIAFDGDGDRLGVVDNQGKIIYADRQLMLFAKDVLSTKLGAEIIYDVKCTRLLGEQIKKAGGRPVMWKSGHSFIKSRMKQTAAALGGEMSGHIFLNDRWFGFDDALYAASRLIEILSSDTRTSHEVFADYPDNINTPEIRIPLEEGQSQQLMKGIQAQAQFDNANIVDIDGLRVEFNDGWGLVRASNTIPALILRFEANGEEALKRIQNQFKTLLTSVNADLSIPF